MQDPRVCEVGNLGENQQVIPPEAVRALPGIAVFVEAREHDAVAWLAFFGLVAPDGRLDAADAEPP